jgi:transcriptional regulator of met regulon
MKYKVIEAFIDKYTGERYPVNTVLEITKERAEEILTKGNLITKVKTTKRVVE